MRGSFFVLLLVSFLGGTTISTAAFSPAAFARTTQNLDELRSGNELREFARQQAAAMNPLPNQMLFLSTNVSDQTIDELEGESINEIQFRDSEVQEAADTLVRNKGPFPVVIGEVGVGKSVIADLFVRQLVLGQYPQSPLYKKKFDKAIVLRASGRSFLPGGTDLDAYINTIKFISENIGRPIIVMIDECHFMTDYNVSVLRGQMNTPNPLPVWLETDSKSYGNSLKGHPSFMSIAQPIMVREMNRDQVKAIVSEESKRIKDSMNVQNSDDVVNAIVDISKDYRRDISEPRRSLTLLENFSINQHRANPDATAKTKKTELYRFVANKIGLPVLPQDEAAFAKFMNGVRDRMKERIIGQDHMVDGVVDQFVAALTSRTRQHSVALMLGPTGVGKSLLPEILAEEFYGDKNRYMELDMTQFSDTFALTSLFGASNGYVSSDKEKGALCDFFDGRGQGGGILVLNEIEEMSSEVFTRFMEIFDKGEFRGGDGKLRYLGRTLVVLTSNKNSDKIMSYDSIRNMTATERRRRLDAITQDQLKKAFTEKAAYTQDDSKVVKAAVLERVDHLYFATPLLVDEAIQVSQLEIDKFQRNYQEQTDAKLTLDPSVAQVITSAFYNPSLGARQVRTAVQQSLTQIIQAFKAKYGYKVKNIQISARTHPSKKTVTYLTATDPATGNTLTIDGPLVPVENKMLDSNFRERLAKLDDNLKTEIFGQDEAIKAVVSAIKARFMRGGKENIVAGFLAGQTGSGKSQLAKSLAKFLFDRPNAYGLFEMGRINDMLDLYTIFSPPKGIVGSDGPGELEKFLINNPEGGVLLFDEMSNAGAGNKAIKEAIAKQFYTMFQEGIYRTPSGKVYDLSNYVVILTGNDGEEVFRGMTSDSMLEAAYEEATKQPGMVDEMLRKAGFSEAFIGRLSFSVLMRPTLGETKIAIARKLLGQWRKEMQGNQPFDIEYDDAFVKQVGELMFSPRYGARSIDRFIGRVLGQAVGDEALKFDWDYLLETGTRGKLAVKLKVMKPDVPFYNGDEPDKTEAILEITSSQDGNVISNSDVVFTQLANFMPQVYIENARATAYHEMGHAVASFTEITGKKVRKITIIPEKIGELSTLGYAQYKHVPTKGEPDRAYLVRVIAGLLAGSEAEGLIERTTTTGRGNDVQKVGEIARRIVLENHLLPGLDSAHAYVEKDGQIVNTLPPRKRRIFEDYVDKAIDEARALAIETLKKHWEVVEAGVKILMEKGVIDGEEFDALMAQDRAANDCSANLELPL